MQSGQPPKTTVVIAVWDDYAGAPLDDAIASIRSQDSPQRLLIVDNASGTPIVVHGDADIIRTPHRVSLGAARNVGLGRVETPYVILWDADDAMLPGTLARLEAGLDSDAELVAFGAAIIEYPTGVRHRWPRAWMPRLARRRRLFAIAHSVWSLYPTTGSTIMRSSAVRDAGGYGRIESGEDWVLGVSLVFRGRIGWSETPGRLYRMHSSSVWAGHADVSHLLHHARAVRERIRTDRAIPRWVRAALPVIAVGQYLAVGLHLCVTAARALRTAGSRRGGTNHPAEPPVYLRGE